MPKSHNPLVQRLGIALFLSLISCGSGFFIRAHAQPASEVVSTASGIEFYKKGQTQAAIKILTEVVKQHPDDADAWYFLGLAYYGDSAIWQAGVAFRRVLGLRPNSVDATAKLAYALILANELGPARKAALHAIELGDQSAEPHYAIAEASFRAGDYPKAIEEADKALKINPDFGPALITKSLGHSSLKQYDEAAVSLEKFLAVSPGDPDADVWREQMNRLRNFDQPASGSTGSPTVAQPAADLPLSGRDVTTKARVLAKAEPTYTEAARKAGVTGTVVIRCVFGSDGEVRNLVLVKALGYGLTSKAVEVARKIRFVPATKEGRQVSMWMELQYNFNLF